MVAGIHYIRKNHTDAVPRRYLFVDTETRATVDSGIELHKMVLGWTWYVERNAQGQLEVDEWREHLTKDSLAEYLFSLAQPKKPLLVLGSNIVFDVWASGLAEKLHFGRWTVHTLFHKGTRSILSFERGQAKIKFLSVQNFVPGSVQAWGDMLGIPKLEVDFQDGTDEGLSAYCRRDVLITGRVFLHYLDFILEYDLGGFALTISGQAFRAYRHRFMKEKILHYDVDAFNAFVRSGYHGGRTEAFFLGKIEGEEVVKVDVNSMYPFVMSTNKFPVKIRQWVHSPPLAWLKARLKTGCVMARVKLATDDPVYPVKINGKLMFPIGTFTTTLCTASLQWALDQGHLTEIEEAIAFHSAPLFREYVDFFYRLKLDYEEGGNPVWREVCKGMLNHLYGKFGELRDRELINTEDETYDFYRRPCSFVIRGDEPMSRRPGRSVFEAQIPDGETVQGLEWCAFGRYVCTCGTEEGENSAPAIAAHVTDYARMKLWKAMATVGLDNLYYVDTDSMILPKSKLEYLQKELDNHALGEWKLEAVEQYLEIRGAKDYSLGGESVQKGIRRDAARIGLGRVVQPVFPSLYTLIRSHSFKGYPIGQSSRSTTTLYDKGCLGGNGRVHPWTLIEGLGVPGLA